MFTTPLSGTQMQHFPLISIILPVYNQSRHIGALIQSYQRSLGKITSPYELILVVNGCRDESLEICTALAQTSPETVRVIHSEQGGWGLAVKLGLAEAQGDLICYTNSARTSSEDLILHVLYALAHPNVVIKANRKIREHWLRRLGSLLYNLECRMLFDLATWDINGTPKVFPRKFEQLLNLTRQDDLIDAEFNIICRYQNYPVLEVPIFSTRRHSGKSSTNFKSALRMYWGACQLRKSLPNFCKS
jgi:glycosyltransferase involved in cell wall biosynthesis